MNYPCKWDEEKKGSQYRGEMVEIPPGSLISSFFLWTLDSKRHSKCEIHQHDK